MINQLLEPYLIVINLMKLYLLNTCDEVSWEDCYQNHKHNCDQHPPEHNSSVAQRI